MQFNQYSIGLHVKSRFKISHLYSFTLSSGKVFTDIVLKQKQWGFHTTRVANTNTPDVKP